MEDNSITSEESDSKICITCEKKLNILLFDKKRNSCKPCRNLQIKMRREKNKNIAKKIITNKQCITCKEDKQISEFTKSSSTQDGYLQYCKSCVRISRKKTSNTEQTEQTNIEKICFKCNISKSLINFKKWNKSKDGLYNICNTCWPDKKWTKEKQKDSEKKYIENNKEKIKLKWKNDGKKINKRIRDALNKRIKQSLFSKKNNNTFSYIGCDIEILQKWFEFCFEDNMSWDNYGEWHIDHIKPCYTFDLSKDEDIKQCFNWKNIRPCWAKDNLEKSNKIDNNLIELYKNKVNIFQNTLLNTNNSGMA
jgi:hypothetical protein